MMIPLLLGLTLTSPDVKTGVQIPQAFVWNKNGCHGQNRTPRLTWDAPPPGTRTLSISVYDHDAPGPRAWLHWSVFRIPPTARGLGAVMPPGVLVLTNDFGTVGWGGPCPPPGQLHHYTFTLHAVLDNGHIVNAQLIPVYKR
jgi:Raf kinase inhibitor-like YbhB/YbcL family protein